MKLWHMKLWLLFLLLLLLPTWAFAQAKLLWDAPTTWADGTPLADPIAYYSIYTSDTLSSNKSLLGTSPTTEFNLPPDAKHKWLHVTAHHPQGVSDFASLQWLPPSVILRLRIESTVIITQP